MRSTRSLFPQRYLENICSRGAIDRRSECLFIAIRCHGLNFRSNRSTLEKPPATPHTRFYSFIEVAFSHVDFFTPHSLATFKLSRSWSAVKALIYLLPMIHLWPLKVFCHFDHTQANTCNMSHVIRLTTASDGCLCCNLLNVTPSPHFPVDLPPMHNVLIKFDNISRSNSRRLCFQNDWSGLSAY